MSAASLFQSAGIDPASSAASPAEGLTPEQLREAFGLFTEATAKFSQTYEALQARVRELDLQLSETNSQLQKNLAEKERVKDYLAAILAGLPVGVAVVDEQGVVKTVNPAAQALLALDESACVGRPVSELFEQLGCWESAARHLEGEPRSVRRIELTLKRPDRTECDVELILMAASPEQRSAFGGVIAFHDVTLLKKLEQRSARVSRLTAMGEMAMNVAHEIRNPLGSIELFASALARDLADRPKQRQLAEYISAGVRGIESIVENILQFNRPRRLDARPVALAETLRESLRYASHLFQQKNVELVWRVEDETARVVGDPELLRQVFLNLAMNGAQAMENGGQLEVRVAATDGAATVEFLDQGSGIDPDLLPKIFDPFITTRRKGTGLGLTIVHNIVTAHGGSVEIANRQDRQGARAAVEIPLAEAG